VSVIIEDDITSIGNQTFYECINLSSITIPNSVTSIGEWAFYGCNSLSSVIIPIGITSIGNATFYECSSLISVTIPNGVTSIGEWAFGWCEGLSSVIIPNGVISIGNYAFYGCNSLTAIDVQENNTAYASENGVLFNKEKTILIQYSAGKPDVDYTIPGSVTRIEDRAFFYSGSLVSITIPESVTGIGYAAFSRCSSLTSVTIPDGVTNIGIYTFSDCSSLVSFTIPESVTSIGDYAFFNCTGLTSVTNLNPTPQSINSTVFTNVNISDVTLYVPAESEALYNTTDVWQDFGTITPLAPTVIDAPANTSTVRVYFDPATGSLRIEGLDAPAQVTVITAGGQIVWRQTVRESESLATGHLPQGVYLVNVNGKTFKTKN
jgi:hypothetical protein